jgi:hypothetical protein
MLLGGAFGLGISVIVVIVKHGRFNPGDFSLFVLNAAVLACNCAVLFAWAAERFRKLQPVEDRNRLQTLFSSDPARPFPSRKSVPH